MKIRNYEISDETEWLKCRVLSFLDTSYYNDVLTKRERYFSDAICLVAEEKGTIIGLLDVEIEGTAGSLCVAGTECGAVIWHLAVLPEYRRQNVATALWNEAAKQLKERGIRYCEVWTQEDEAANRWYQKQGFSNLKEHNWLRCYAHVSQRQWFLKEEAVGEIYGVEEMIFEAPASRKEELAPHCNRMIEVRLYAKEL